VTEAIMETAAEPEAQPGTALVPLSVQQPEPVRRRPRPSAPVVAQMLATRLDAPQTRSRRRAQDSEAAAVYGAAGEAIKIGKRAPGAAWDA